MIDQQKEDVAERIASLCDELEIDCIVVGLPVSLTGDEGKAAAEARRFGEEIIRPLGRNLIYWDERFTTVQAEKALLESGMRRERRRDIRDKVAAAFMLQGYLDALNEERYE